MAIRDLNVDRSTRAGPLARTLGLTLCLLGLAAVSLSAKAPRTAVVLDITGAIGPATSDYFHRGLEKAKARNAALVILRIDTPGGLDTSMRDIIRDILASPIPVVTYVAPSGARAASAGTYILYASHVAAMAPGTNLGAATPVQIGGLPKIAPTPEQPAREREKAEEEKADKADTADQEEKTDKAPKEKDKAKEPRPKGPAPTMSEKIVNDAAAYIRGLAQLRGRNEEWAERAVREAASLSAEEALKAGVIDLVADDVEALLEAIDGRHVALPEGKERLETAGLEISLIEPDWRTEILGIITNPNVAYFLMLIGMYGLVYEFTHPGLIAPGVVGAISLLLALFAFQVLPINYAGLGLIVLGFSFMVAEAFMPAFGALGIGGLIAFVVGSVMLIDTDAPGFQISWPLIGSVAFASGGVFTIALGLAVKARNRPVVSGQEEMTGIGGHVTDWGEEEGRVRVHGETWRAVAERPLEPGTRVRVAAMDGLVLTVEPAEDEKET